MSHGITNYDVPKCVFNILLRHMHIPQYATAL